MKRFTMVIPLVLVLFALAGILCTTVAAADPTATPVPATTPTPAPPTTAISETFAITIPVTTSVQMPPCDGCDAWLVLDPGENVLTGLYATGTVTITYYISDTKVTTLLKPGEDITITPGSAGTTISFKGQKNAAGIASATGQELAAKLILYFKASDAPALPKTGWEQGLLPLVVLALALILVGIVLVIALARNRRSKAATLATMAIILLGLAGAAFLGVSPALAIPPPPTATPTPIPSPLAIPTPALVVKGFGVMMDGHLLVEYTDGSFKDLGNVVGQAGKDGKDGQPGKDGLPGKDGVPGKDGLPGEPGVGIESVEVINGHLIITFTNNVVEDVGYVKGQPGPGWQWYEKAFIGAGVALAVLFALVALVVSALPYIHSGPPVTPSPPSQFPPKIES